MTAGKKSPFGWVTAYATAHPPAGAERPDIVVIMVDDMGFSDLGCYGGEIDTPNIDSLAAGGVRFSQFYNNSRCCPTRAALLTGLHPHQAGIGHMTNEFGDERTTPPAYQGFLNRRCVTFAEVLRSVGYTTLMAGKWHVATTNQEQWPLQRGFDNYYGCLTGATNYFNPKQPRGITLGNEIDEELKSTTDRRYYTTDAFTDYAIRFIDEEVANTDQKFFLYLAYTAPHWPLQAHEEDIAKYRGKYRIGWDRLRRQRFNRQVQLGLISKEWGLSPRDAEVPAWNSLDETQQDELDLRMAIYAAMIDRIDQNVGKLVSRLRELGRFDNTLILFLSDNGACAEGGILGREEVLHEHARNRSGGASYGTAWANASATPYRLYKHYTHEGGACTPFVMHWPEKIKPQSDWYREPAQIIDIMPTLLDVGGASYPNFYSGHEITSIEGLSLVPAFTGEPLDRQSAIFTEHEGNAMARDGKWKLVGSRVAGRDGVRTENWELYDMLKDGAELVDVSDEQPGVVSRMSSQWEEWAFRAQVYPKIIRSR